MGTSYTTNPAAAPSSYEDPYLQHASPHSISNNPPPMHPSQQTPYSPTSAAQMPPVQPPYSQSPRNQQPPLDFSQPSILKQPEYGETEVSPARPVFGLSLDDLFSRDGSAVPMVVYQCLQAVDLFGLDVEGIYRLSGNAAHIAKLRSVFDHGIVACSIVRERD